MAKMILIPMMLFVLLEGGAQHASLRVKMEENEIPQRVVGAFRRQYEGVPNASWVIISSSSLENDFGISGKNGGEKLTYYDVAFSSADGQNEVVYDHFGHCVGVKKMINTASLPRSVISAGLENEASRSIASAWAIFSGTSGVLHYVLVIRDESGEQMLVISKDGELLKVK